MRVVQRLRALEDDLDHVVDAQQVVRLAVGRERARAVNVLGNDVIVAVFLARIVDRQDVRVLEAPHHLRLVEEHLARDARLLLVFLGLAVVDLYRDVAAVVRVMGKENATAGALSDLIDYVVFADTIRDASPFFGCRCDVRFGLDHESAQRRQVIDKPQ